jgi:DNA-binding IclR family transcriptional regulator
MARAAPASARAAAIISFLTAHPTRGFTISELVKHLGMNIASAHATLAVLSDCGFVIRDPVHRTYVLGPALAATGFAVLEQHPAIGAAVERAEALSLETGAETGVVAIAGRDVVLLARGGHPQTAEGIGYPGDRSPLIAPFGEVFMAWAGEEEVAGWLARADVSGPLAAMYREVLADIRRRGFSIVLQAVDTPNVRDAMSRLRADPADENAEQLLVGALQQAGEMLLLPGGLAEDERVAFKAIAAPVFDPIGRVLLTMSIIGSDEPVTVGEILGLGRRLAQEATAVTRQARGRLPEAALPRAAGGAGQG